MTLNCFETTRGASRRRRTQGGGIDLLRPYFLNPWCKSALTVFLSLSLACCAAAGNREANTIAAIQAPGGQTAKASGRTPAPPAVLLDTTYARPTGRVITVGANGAPRNFQAALDAARLGDVISLESGATFLGNFKLPKKEGSGWITIRTSATDAKLPPPGTRITPAHSSVMPKLVSPNADAAISTAPGAHHYRFIGVEFTTAPGWAINYGLILFGDSGPQRTLEAVPHNLIIDRCYIHGNADVNLRRGVAINSASTAIIDSYISDIHEKGADSQAICGWNGPGPFKIVNNYLEGAGENFMLGGADPRIESLVPSDVEFRLNHCFKPLSWNPADPGFSGKRWSVKNLFELKNARRVLIDGNHFENNWKDAQAGAAILFTPRNQEGTAPWSTVEDVAFTNNIVTNVAAGVSILGKDDIHPSQQAQRITIENNLFDRVGGAKLGANGRLFQILNGPANVTINHNTAFQVAQIIVADGLPSEGFVYTNNITAAGQYGIFGTGAGEGHTTLAKFFPGALISKNVFVGRPSRLYPAGNFFVATMNDVGFADDAGGNYKLKEGSAYKCAGTDGRDIGCDIEKLGSKR